MSQLVTDASAASEEAASANKRLQESEASRQDLEADLAEVKRNAAALKSDALQTEARISELQQVPIHPATISLGLNSVYLVSLCSLYVTFASCIQVSSRILLHLIDVIEVVPSLCHSRQIPLKMVGHGTKET